MRLASSYFLTVLTRTPLAAAAVLTCLGTGLADAQTTNDATSAQSDASAVASLPPTWDFAWKDHPAVTFGDVARVEFRARLSAETRLDDDEDDSSRFDPARRRIGVRGELWKTVDFEVEGEVADPQPWRDVFANYHVLNAVQVQGGRFKMPFGLDENTGPNNREFVYRSHAARDLAPGRANGVMAHGRLGMVRYELGVFATDGDNAIRHPDTRVHGDSTAAVRLVVQPFHKSRSRLSDFQVGAAYTGTKVPEGFADLNGHTFGGKAFFKSDVWVRGAQRRVGLESRWRPGPFSFQTEYIRINTERRGQSLEGNDLPALVARGWYVSGAWVLAGARKVESAPTPKRPLFGGGLGSIELAARAERLTFASTDAGFLPSTSPRAEVILPRGNAAITLGINWFPNRWLKIQANVIRESFTNATAFPVPLWSHVFSANISL